MKWKTVNNLSLIDFNLLFINFLVYAWRIKFGNRTPTNVLKVYFLLLEHYILKDFLKNILAEFNVNVRDDDIFMIQPEIMKKLSIWPFIFNF